jgi:hypothetical protein
VDSNTSSAVSYESPSITVVGNVHEVTQNGKTFSKTNDYSYPAVITDTYGPLNFS